MSLFFFHFVTESERDEDAIGLELPSAEAAYLEAVGAAYSMANQLLAEGIDASRCSFEIANARGELLMAVDFAELLKRNPRMPPSDQNTSRLAKAIEDTHRRVTVAKHELKSSLKQARSAISESLELISRLDSYDRVRAAAAPDRDAA